MEVEGIPLDNSMIAFPYNTKVCTLFNCENVTDQTSWVRPRRYKSGVTNPLPGL